MKAFSTLSEQGHHVKIFLGFQRVSRQHLTHVKSMLCFAVKVTLAIDLESGPRQASYMRDIVSPLSSAWWLDDSLVNLAVLSSCRMPTSHFMHR